LSLSVCLSVEWTAVCEKAERVSNSLGLGLGINSEFCYEFGFLVATLSYTIFAIIRLAGLWSSFVEQIKVECFCGVRRFAFCRRLVLSLFGLIMY
jgi:hypothetical protein